jgi:FdhD protein
MQSVFADVVLVTNTPDQYLSLPVKILTDRVPYQGPLGAIASAMERSPNPYVFTVACDMPLVNKTVIEEIIHRGRGWNAAIPVYQGQCEYLLALYSQGLLESMGAALGRGIRSLHEYCHTLQQVAFLPLNEDASCNVNTPQDLAALEKRYAL